MAVSALTHPTLLDMAKMMEPDGTIASVVEILNQTNEMLADMSFMEGNLITGHQVTIRTGIPMPVWRKLYGGVYNSKSSREQVTESCGMMETYHECDKAEADLSGNQAAFRLSDSTAILEGFSQKLQNTVLYGDSSVEPAAFTGLAPRYSSLSAPNADNIIDAGGTGADNRSIWLTVWGPETVFGLIPKHSTAGLQIHDKGQVTIENVDGSGGKMEGYRTHFRQDAGLCVKDWRYVVRICNIDKSLLSEDMSTGANLPSLMFEAVERIPALGMGRAAFYMSRDLRTMLSKQMSNGVKNSTLTKENVGGVRSPTFDEIPIRRVDALAVDEARVV